MNLYLTKAQLKALMIALDDYLDERVCADQTDNDTLLINLWNYLKDILETENM